MLAISPPFRPSRLTDGALDRKLPLTSTYLDSLRISSILLIIDFSCPFNDP